MKSSIGSRKMEHYRKLYNLKRLEVRIPRLANIPYKKLRSSRNGATNFWQNDSSFSQEENSIVLPQSIEMENSVVHVSQCYSTDDELTSPPDLLVEESSDHHSESSSSLDEDFMSLDACLPSTQPEEPENDLFVVTIDDDDEVVHIYEKIKEETEKSAETYRTKPNVSGKDCNSTSTFIEKEEESIMDRTYFHIFSMEVEGENEVCLNGVFVKDS